MPLTNESGERLPLIVGKNIEVTVVRPHKGLGPNMAAAVLNIIWLVLVQERMAEGLLAHRLLWTGSLSVVQNSGHCGEGLGRLGPRQGVEDMRPFTFAIAVPLLRMPSRSFPMWGSLSSCVTPSTILAFIIPSALSQGPSCTSPQP